MKVPEICNRLQCIGWEIYTLKLKPLDPPTEAE